MQKISEPTSEIQPSKDLQSNVHRFTDLAVNGLAAMFDEQRGLFCYRLRKTDNGLVQEGLSTRYTMMTLMGLHRLQQAGGVSPIKIDSVLERLMTDFSWVDNIGDLGVLLWLCGIVCPERLAELERRLKIKTALDCYPEVKRGLTMELAWFLTGISYWGMACPDKLPDLKELAFGAYAILKQNQGKGGFFSHLKASGVAARLTRGPIGSFADQVYPIYALTQFSKAYANREASDRAISCALGICRAQGPLGQWWWHYDSARGRVLEGYPVFSVHQHGMGPMVLFALGDTLQYDFSSWVNKGLQWINTRNELRFDMEEASGKLIWRCIYRSESPLVSYSRAAFRRRSQPVQERNPKALRVLFECRPYELGWLLYAFANRVSHNSTLEEGPHITEVSQPQVVGTN